MYSIQCTDLLVYSVTVYSVQCSVYSVEHNSVPVYSLQCSVYSVEYNSVPVYSVQCSSEECTSLFFQLNTTPVTGTINVQNTESARL